MKLRVVLTALMLCAAPLTAAISFQSALAATTPDPAKVAVVEQIYANLGIIDVMKNSMQATLAADPSMSNFTQVEKDKLIEIAGQVVEEQRQPLLHKLAVQNLGDLTDPQLQVILKVSKIKYIKDAVIQGADPSHVADPSTMTSQESAFLNSVSNEQYILDFLQRSANFDPVKPDLEAIATTVVERFVTWLSAQKS